MTLNYITNIIHMKLLNLFSEIIFVFSAAAKGKQNLLDNHASDDDLDDFLADVIEIISDDDGESVKQFLTFILT